MALANLRGGGEFGREWHEAGQRERKQNVFDDFIAVGEHLVANGVTAHGQLALHGRSNGGLLVGAVMTQRPDLTAVALPMVGVLDKLRFHKFTIGAAWIPEKGDPDVAEDFAFLYAYSPLHALRAGTSYPATHPCCSGSRRRPGTAPASRSGCWPPSSRTCSRSRRNTPASCQAECALAFCFKSLPSERPEVSGAIPVFECRSATRNRVKLSR